MARITIRWAGTLLLATVGLLGGCATSYRLDNTVQTFSGLQALPAPPTYRFDRLPSQQAAPGQADLESLADPALFRAGLKRDDAAPRYAVQVSARVQQVVSPWADPWDGWGGWGHFGYGRFHRGAGLGFGYGYPLARGPEPSWFRREVSVVMRDVTGGKVVYETHAVNDGPLLDNKAVLTAMFDAALQGFPAGSLGPKRVDIQIPNQ